MRTYGLPAWALAGAITAGAIQAETLYQRDGITLEGTARVEFREAAVCAVLAENHPPEAYERLRGNHGQPLHVWRLDFSVRNGSERRLEHLTAHFGIQSEAPPCTSWDSPKGNYAKPVQWANSFHVLQKPDGMGLGDEVSDTVFVLAFHDRQPKFESWKVDYRFAEKAGREAGPAQGAPAFIVVPVPAHATVSLLNVAQPYRRRMPLERGRYQVEVSAPGYRTHRAWVDHEQTWPHRIELERLPGGDGSATLSVLDAAPAGQLPPEVQVDLNLRKAEQALKEGDAATARQAMERLVALQQEHGLEPEEEDHIRYAQAWEAAGEPERAMEAVVRYLQLRGRQATQYEDALDLMNRAESAQRGLASEVSEASPVVPTVPQREPSYATDRSEPAIGGTAGGEPVRVQPPEIMAVRDLRIAEQAVQDQDLKTARLTIERLQELGDEYALGPVIEARVRNLQLRLREAESPEKPRPEIASGGIRELGGRASGQTIVQAENCDKWNTEKFFKTATVETVTACLDAGADLNAPGGWKQTPLHWAVLYSPWQAVVRALLAAGADVHAQDKWGATPLHRATRRDDAPLIRMLLAAGADTESRTAKNGYTPLHIAAMWNRIHGLNALLAGRADPNARTNGGKSPMDLARKDGKRILAAAGGQKGGKLAASSRQKAGQNGRGGLGALLAGAAVAGIGAASGVDASVAVEAGLATTGAVLNDQQANQVPSQSAESSNGGTTLTGPALTASGPCMIPGFPDDPDTFKSAMDTLGFSTCPVQPRQYGVGTDFQVRSQVINAALHQCMLADATPEQAAGFRQVIRQSCEYAAAMSARGGPSCTCPPEVLRDGR